MAGAGPSGRGAGSSGRGAGAEDAVVASIPNSILLSLVVETKYF